MIWKQELDIPKHPFIEYNDRFFSIGSCFSSNMGNLLQSHGFETAINPMGILFNPIAMATLFDKMVNGKKYTASDVFHFEGNYHILELQNRYQGTDQDSLLVLANEALQEAEKELEKASVILLTLGTSIVHKFKPTGRVVGNNHKLPADHFERYEMNVSEVRASLVQSMRYIRKAAPNCNIILTVSPIRHLRSGTIANSRSKATLIAAVHETMEQFQKVHYFPAFEIMMDELRDYRFYKEDLIHPSDQAIQYVWERFEATHFKAKAALLVEKMKRYHAMKAHRPLAPDSTEYKSFIVKMNSLKNSIEREFDIKLDE